MISFSVKEIAEISSSTIIGNSSSIINQIIIDSRLRTTYENAIFLAIPGKQTNGHSFIQDMYDKGCKHFWVQKNHIYPQFSDAVYIESDSVLYAFQLLISAYRKQFALPVVGITGSNGKTIVKEWLYHIIKNDLNTVRSPKSYNSQIGVPLSISLLDANHTCAIFEAGISEVNEMNYLQQMIQPSIGIFTNIGDAHQQNFESIEQKVSEKMKLFSETQSLVYCSDYAEIHTQIQKLPKVTKYAWSLQKDAQIPVSYVITKDSAQISLTIDVTQYKFSIPFTDTASIENAVHAWIAYYILCAQAPSASLFADLPHIAMRLEQKAGINNCTLINDAYNSDFNSLKIALQFLGQQKQHTRKTVFLSDIKQTGVEQALLYKDIATLLQEYSITRVFGVGQQISQYLGAYFSNAHFYNSTAELIADLPNYTFENETILLKAAREYEFELLAKRLEMQSHKTVLEINLNAIIHNLQYFRSRVKPETKIMVMVKAFSYGSGSYEIANVLQHHRVDYLAVAFVDEGIELRKAGITLPIVVMNPEIGMLEQIFTHNLQPNIHNMSILAELQEYYATHNSQELNIHIKLDTGMARYGFPEEIIDSVIEKCKAMPNCNIVSVFSHLVGSDEACFDDFTETQIQSFICMSEKIQSNFSYSIIRHILNSAGIERFSQYQFNMVRLGIGLYGISAENESNCMHVGTLKTFVSEIRNMPSGSTVGYSRKGKIQTQSTIAVLPIGYADGLRRKLSNGLGTVIIKGVEVPIVGNICMDATFIDITGLDLEIGEEVVVFGAQSPIQRMAEKLETIPYEIITSISRRVQRVYYYE